MNAEDKADRQVRVVLLAGSIAIAFSLGVALGEHLKEKSMQREALQNDVAHWAVGPRNELVFRWNTPPTKP